MKSVIQIYKNNKLSIIGQCFLHKNDHEKQLSFRPKILTYRTNTKSNSQSKNKNSSSISRKNNNSFTLRSRYNNKENFQNTIYNSKSKDKKNNRSPGSAINNKTDQDYIKLREKLNTLHMRIRSYQNDYLNNSLLNNKYLKKDKTIITKRNINHKNNLNSKINKINITLKNDNYNYENKENININNSQTNKKSKGNLIKVILDKSNNNSKEKKLKIYNNYRNDLVLNRSIEYRKRNKINDIDIKNHTTNDYKNNAKTERYIKTNFINQKNNNTSSNTLKLFLHNKNNFDTVKSFSKNKNKNKKINFIYNNYKNYNKIKTQNNSKEKINKSKDKKRIFTDSNIFSSSNSFIKNNIIIPKKIKKCILNKDNHVRKISETIIPIEQINNSITISNNNSLQSITTNDENNNNSTYNLYYSKSQKDFNSNNYSKIINKTNSHKTIKNSYQKISPKTKINKKIINIDSLCQKGFSGPGIKKINQDNFFIYNNFLNNPEYIFMGICDGHGIYGHEVSSYIVNNLPIKINTILQNELLSNFSIENLKLFSPLITHIFLRTNLDIINNKLIDTNFSGSTCVSLIFTPSKLLCINIGDSRCIIAKKNNEKWFSKNLSNDHKPENEIEKQRILLNNGKIESYKNEKGEEIGPKRVWLKNEDVPGLAMSRSFGDEVAHSVGVSSLPEIKEYEFLKEDKFIVLASDGIWEFISNDECVNIVKNYYLCNDMEGALSCLYKEASRRWIMEEEVIDDITIIIVFLEDV